MPNETITKLTSFHAAISSISKDMVTIRNCITKSDPSSADEITKIISSIGLYLAELDAAASPCARLKAYSLITQSVATCSVIIAKSVEQGLFSEDEYISWAKSSAKSASMSTAYNFLTGMLSTTLSSK